MLAGVIRSGKKELRDERTGKENKAVFSVGSWGRQGRARREGRVESLSGRNATSGDPLENAIGKGDLGSQISKGGEDVSVWGGNLISLPRQTR